MSPEPPDEKRGAVLTGIEGPENSVLRKNLTEPSISLGF
jgi:hypothetical protein